MNILVTLNSAYVDPLCTMLRSLAASNKNERITLYVAHSSLTERDFEKIQFSLGIAHARICPILLDDELFENAPILKRVSKETYYRIFAPLYLPRSVDRVLYIDPDTVVINPLKKFYQTDFGGSYIIGAKHFDGPVDVWNRGRLGIKHSDRYINAGIMLMNIAEMRKSFDKNKVFSIIKKYNKILFLADQDAINILYDGKIKTYTEFVINLDERTFSHMLKRISVDEALELVKANTMIIHFNGKYKPWKDGYQGYLKQFYDDYKEFRPVLYKRGA